ncbi:MAG: polysaccharide deacetylase family protein [Actinobacteria bacterium]|nr:polysaccharide deacetylase family protein [Actinomycetota bacterium]
MKKPYQIISSAIAILLVTLVARVILKQPELLGWLSSIEPAGWIFNIDPAHLLIIFVLIGAGCLAAFISYFEYHGIGCQDGVVRRGPHESVVAITFDDGPNPIYTPQILDILKEKGVKATFFVVGLHVRKYPDIARRIVAEGHDIGNHTYTHKDLVPATRRMVLAQAHKTDQVIKRITGASSSLFRPPRGIFSSAVRRLLVDKEGYRLILWTVSSVDWRRVSPRAILRRISRHTRPGAILLFHDSGALIRREGASRDNTVEALPMVIDHLRAKGYEMVTISEMLRRLEEEEMEAAGIWEQA